MDDAAIHVKRTMTSLFYRTADRPEASLPDRHEVRVTKNIRAHGADYHRGQRTYTLKIFRGLRKTKTKTKKAHARELIPAKHSAEPRSVRVAYRTGVLYNLRRVDLQHVQ